MMGAPKGLSEAERKAYIKAANKRYYEKHKAAILEKRKVTYEYEPVDVDRRVKHGKYIKLTVVMKDE